MREQRKVCAGERVLTDYARSLIRFKARQLSRRAGFSRSDRDDLEQDLWAALLAQADRFDPSRACLNTFADRVVNSAAAMILRDRQRQKRADGLQAQSLNAPLGRDGQPETLGCGLSEADHRRRIGTEPPDEAGRRDDADAVRHALASMAPHVADVCRRVLGGSISSAAQELGTSRRQIRKALDAARPFLERAGYGET
jgi:RNA polymerase sigma-70 factor (ECF subfamily)